MEATKQLVRTPKDHEIRVKIPQHVPENELVEIIMIFKTQQNEFEQKINTLKAAMSDQLFLKDLQDVSQDFEAVDLERWEA